MSALPPGEYAAERLSTGKFQVAVADLRIGLDPDLYPLLASSQTLTGGSNVDRACRIPTSMRCSRRPVRPARTASGRPRTAPSRSSSPRAATCCRWPSPDEVVVVRDTRRGTRRPPGHRRVGSILGCANMAPRCRPVTVDRGPCRGGGIGRRAGFRYQWPQGRVGSSPSLGTIPPTRSTVTPAQVAELVYAYV